MQAEVPGGRQRAQMAPAPGALVGSGCARLGQHSAGCVPPGEALAGTGAGRGCVAGALLPRWAVLINHSPFQQPPHKSSPERNQERALPHPFNKSVL